MVWPFSSKESASQAFLKRNRSTKRMATAKKALVEAKFEQRLESQIATLSKKMEAVTREEVKVAGDIQETLKVISQKATNIKMVAARIFSVSRTQAASAAAVAEFDARMARLANVIESRSNAADVQGLFGDLRKLKKEWGFLMQKVNAEKSMADAEQKQINALRQKVKEINQNSGILQAQCAKLLSDVHTTEAEGEASHKELMLMVTHAHEQIGNIERMINAGKEEIAYERAARLEAERAKRRGVISKMKAFR